jgi:hypothetical protein
MPVTASTPANLVIGAGDLYVDTVALGASSGNNDYTVTQTWFVPELNGVPGKLIGTHYKISEEAVLKTQDPEISAAVLAKTWPGSRSATVGTVTTLDTDGTRRIPTGDYHDWELRVPGLNGRSFSFFVDNGINQANQDFSSQNAGMMSPTAEIHSTWDPAALSASPHRIKITIPAS